MKRKTPADWQQIIEEQMASGKTATEFCYERGLNPKYFSLRKTRLQNEQSAFVKTVVKPRSPAGITLQKSDVTITLPANTSPHWLAQLLHELAV